LAQQLGKYTTHEALGLKLSEQQLSELREDQIGQLFELFQQIQKPSSPSEGGTRSDSHTGEGGTKSPLAEGGSKLTTDNSIQTGAGDVKSDTSPSAGSW